MVRIEIDTDEWYPVYSIDETVKGLDNYGVVEVPDKVYQKLLKTFEDFAKAQRILGELIRKWEKEN